MEFVRGLLEEVDTHKQDYETAPRIKGLLSVVSEVCTVLQQHGYCGPLISALHISTLFKRIGGFEVVAD